jgi:hypothetical protein
VISSYLVDENGRKVDRYAKVRAKLASNPVAAGQAMIMIYEGGFQPSGD